MKELTTTQNQAVLTMYNLYLNTIDNTAVIVIDTLSSIFERTLTNMGYVPKLIATSYILSDLQVKAIEFGMTPDLITNLDINRN